MSKELFSILAKEISDVLVEGILLLENKAKGQAIFDIFNGTAKIDAAAKSAAKAVKSAVEGPFNTQIGKVSKKAKPAFDAAAKALGKNVQDLTFGDLIGILRSSDEFMEIMGSNKGQFIGALTAATKNTDPRVSNAAKALLSLKTTHGQSFGKIQKAYGAARVAMKNVTSINKMIGAPPTLKATQSAITSTATLPSQGTGKLVSPKVPGTPPPVVQAPPRTVPSGPKLNPESPNLPLAVKKPMDPKLEKIPKAKLAPVTQGTYAGPTKTGLPEINGDPAASLVSAVRTGDWTALELDEVYKSADKSAQAIANYAATPQGAKFRADLDKAAKGPAGADQLQAAELLKRYDGITAAAKAHVNEISTHGAGLAGRQKKTAHLPMDQWLAVNRGKGLVGTEDALFHPLPSGVAPPAGTPARQLPIIEVPIKPGTVLNPANLNPKPFVTKAAADRLTAALNRAGQNVVGASTQKEIADAHGRIGALGDALRGDIPKVKAEVEKPMGAKEPEQLSLFPDEVGKRADGIEKEVSDLVDETAKNPPKSPDDVEKLKAELAAKEAELKGARRAVEGLREANNARRKLIAQLQAELKAQGKTDDEVKDILEQILGKLDDAAEGAPKPPPPRGLPDDAPPGVGTATPDDVRRIVGEELEKVGVRGGSRIGDAAADAVKEVGWAARISGGFAAVYAVAKGGLLLTIGGILVYLGYRLVKYIHGETVVKAKVLDCNGGECFLRTADAENNGQSLKELMGPITRRALNHETKPMTSTSPTGPQGPQPQLDPLIKAKGRAFELTPTGVKLLTAHRPSKKAIAMINKSAKQASGGRASGARGAMAITATSIYDPCQCDYVTSSMIAWYQAELGLNESGMIDGATLASMQTERAHNMAQERAKTTKCEPGYTPNLIVNATISETRASQTGLNRLRHKRKSLVSRMLYILSYSDNNPELHKILKDHGVQPASKQNASAESWKGNKDYMKFARALQKSRYWKVFAKFLFRDDSLKHLKPESEFDYPGWDWWHGQADKIYDKLMETIQDIENYSRKGAENEYAVIFILKDPVKGFPYNKSHAKISISKEDFPSPNMHYLGNVWVVARDRYLTFLQKEETREDIKKEATSKHGKSGMLTNNDFRAENLHIPRQGIQVHTIGKEEPTGDGFPMGRTNPPRCRKYERETSVPAKGARNFRPGVDPDADPSKTAYE